MKASIRIARIMGIPILINVSWLVTISAVTALLALAWFPDVIPERSPYHDNRVWHWIMALAGGLVFFVSILLHELAHSVVALKQGIPVRSITLFIFGGVSQISGEARRPLNEFVMAVAGPVMSVILGLFFLGVWALTSFSEDGPIGAVLFWLVMMNFVLAIFNMAPGFPMDGGRVLRSLLWGVTGNMLTATRLATLVGRGIGYAIMLVGALAFLGLIGFLDNPWTGIWFVIIGQFIQSSARQSWVQARALDLLSQRKAEDLMSTDLPTAEQDEELRNLLSRSSPRFLFFVQDAAEHVVGVITEQETAGIAAAQDERSTAGQLMVKTEAATVAGPEVDGASLFQTMENASIWHLPIVSGGRVLGVVSRENLIRMLAADMGLRSGLKNSP